MGRSNTRVRSRGVVSGAFLLAVALLVAAAATSVGAPSVGAAATIVERGTPSTVRYGPGATSTITVAAPAGGQPGDVLLASIGLGAKSQPVITAPSGWTLVSRTNSGSVSALAVYSHPWLSGEASYTWRTDRAVGATAVVAAFGGVDRSAPVLASAGRSQRGGSSVATPSLTTTAPGAMLVANFHASRAKARATTWTTASGMTEIADVDAGGYRTSATDVALQPTAGSTGTRSATPSNKPDDAMAVLTALRPAASPPATSTSTSTTTTTAPPSVPGGAVPLIVDTDLFSDADDVGALATAFGLQQRGEARVIALGINTRTSRPAVAKDSWRCAAAVANFYGSGSVPIGTAQPNDGTDVNTVDFLKPCAALAPASTPVPPSATSVYRRALAAAADGSVVVAAAGYSGNLAALLASPADSTSPLTGRDLVARKVERLVIMGGGYPSRNGETNLSGDPASAQKVSTGWPTRIVWAGYEVGDAIHAGETISRTHPTSSPVRVAYEAFVGPGNWVYSYDLVAVYAAVRRTDPSLGSVGPGTNTITSTGANSFSTGSGNQHYLTLRDATALENAIEGLITTLPSAPPPPTTTSGPSDTFSGTTLSSRWTTELNGSTVGPSGGRLLITHPAGSWTKGALQSAATHDQTGKALQVQVVRPANGGAGGSTYGETSVFLWLDATRNVSFFFAGGSMSAWVNNGGTQTNLTPSWPAYSPSQMQWVRFRESGGRLYLEYAAGADAPGAWTTLASMPNPFALTSVRLRLVAGANTATADAATFDNVTTG